MEKPKRVKIEHDGQTGFLIIGNREQCLNEVALLEKKTKGHWYEIGYYQRDPRNPEQSIHVWKYYEHLPVIQAKDQKSLVGKV